MSPIKAQITKNFHISSLTVTVVILIEVSFIAKPPSNVDIFTKLVTEIQGLLHRHFWYRQEGVDPLCNLMTLQVLQGNINHADELCREVPAGGVVDEVPLLGVDLSTAGLLSQLSLRHRPGQYNPQYARRDQPLPAPDVNICYAPYVGVPIKGISSYYQNQL